MDSTLAGLPWTTCLVYLDDIVIPGSTFEALVFERLRQAGLKLQPAKCTLCQESVTFQGHIVSIATDPAKTDKVATWSYTHLPAGCAAIHRPGQLLQAKLCYHSKASASTYRKECFI